MSEEKVYSVGAIVRYVGKMIHSDPKMHGVMAEGEISNFHIPSSGHWYFSLKDNDAVLPMIMYRSSASKLKFRPKNGDKVIVKGDVNVYEKDGKLQMLVSSMRPSGIGDLYVQLELLKKKLYAMGLFDPEHKKPLPPYPMRIAVVTGNSTAARSDVLITLKKRWPCAQVSEYTCPVQGASAVPYIIDSLARADQDGHDVILLVRGGGSLEDLWCFNDEKLIRFIYDMNTPVVTGVGHETDTTLVDYVSDKRANTPTGAVEAATPDIAEVKQQLRNMSVRMVQAEKKRSEVMRTRLDHMKKSVSPDRMTQMIDQKYHLVDTQRKLLLHHARRVNNLRSQMSAVSARFEKVMRQSIGSVQNQLTKNRLYILQNMKQRLQKENAALAKDAGMLDALSPLKVLDRGYSIVSLHTHAVKSASELKENDRVQIRFSSGRADAVIEKIYEEGNDGRKEENI